MVLITLIFAIAIADPNGSAPEPYPSEPPVPMPIIEPDEVERREPKSIDDKYFGGTLDFVRYRGLFGAWKWQEVAHLSAGRYIEAGAVALGLGWGPDRWLCEVITANPDECFGQRVRLSFAVEKRVSERTFVSIAPGAYYRSARSREVFEATSEAQDVRRSQTGIEFAVGPLHLIPIAGNVSIGLLGELGIVLPLDAHFPHRRYPRIPLVFEPRAGISVQME